MNGKMIRIASVACALSVLGALAIPCSAEESISSAAFKIIQTSLPELTRRGLSLDGYKITVVGPFVFQPTQELSWAVIFRDIDMDDSLETGQVGIPPPPLKRVFEVNVDISGTKVLGSNFAK